MLSNDKGKLTLENTQGHKVVITAEPLKFEFLDQNGDVSVILNDNAQLLVEPLKTKKEKVVEEEGGDIVEVVSVLLLFVFVALYVMHVKEHGLAYANTNKINIFLIMVFKDIYGTIYGIIW